jgi:para-aminobenzoate synthetase/4-amino-4-deoxychorismate lyase
MLRALQGEAPVPLRGGECSRIRAHMGSIGTQMALLDPGGDGRGVSGARLYARLDALDGTGRSFAFRGLHGVIEARALAEVVPALREVEAAAGRGMHAVGFVAYEAAPALDAALVCRPPAPELPLLWFALFRHRGAAPALQAPAEGEEGELSSWKASLGYAQYAERVAAIREWIAAGDTYQANLTFPLHARFAGSDLALYRELCLSQRSGYCALLRLPRFTIASASPELFFRWRAGELELRPMKGTRPRGRWPQEDRERAAELLRSPKERAENLMIVDLLRSDAGRLAEFGSVHVPALFQVESYPTVHQLTSTIRARTRTGVTLVDLFRALFPSGSVTGAPKVRTMQILAGLEHSPRGVYTGAIGMVSPDEVVFNVPIRTLVLRPGEGTAELGVGSGITFDSHAEQEYRECLQKAAFARGASRRCELLETMLFDPDRGIVLLDEHLDRLAASADYFGYPLDAGAARAACARAVAGADGPCRLRLLVAPGGEARVERHPAGPTLAAIRACVARRPVDSHDPLLYHKTTCREAYRQRLSEHPGMDDVLLRNERGELTEFTIGNLVLRRGGVHWTPPLPSGLLAGVLRGALLRQGALRERVLREEDLRGADAVFRINSVQGWTPVELEGERAGF